MRISSSAIALGIIVLAGSADAADVKTFMIRDGDRVVFYGDSITDSEWYPTLVESYVLTRHPTWRNRFSNRGVSGDNAGSIARFERDVLTQKPDLCTYNMGFNDGGYGHLQPNALATWLANIERSVALARAADPLLRLVLMSPIPSESAVSLDPRWITHAEYPHTMLSFGGEEAKLAARLQLPFIDLGRQYGQSMGLGQVAAGDTFTLSRDGVHPLRVGQALIAYHVLRGLGAEAAVASADIDAANGTVASASRCRISDVGMTDGALHFARASEALPMPIPPEVRPFTFLVRYEDELSSDMLRIRGLTAPAYTLAIDEHKVADLSSEDLAAGINLSSFAATPMHDQALTVMAAVRAKQVAEYAYFRRWIWAKPAKADGAGQPLGEATAAERTAMAADRAAITALEVAAYATCVPRPLRFRLTPLSAAVPRFAHLVAADIAKPRLNLRIAPLATDWNALCVLDRQLSVTLSNPASVPRTAELGWSVEPGWQVDPPVQTVVLAPGATTTVTCAVSAPSGDAVLHPPTLTARWSWSAAWAAPTTLSRQAELAPRLRIAKAVSAPSFTGKLAEWDHATPLVLEDRGFINPAVPGRRPLWHGPADLSARIRLQWNADALLIAALVRDDSHVQQANRVMAWSEDCMMLGIAIPAGAQHEFLCASYADRTEAFAYIGGGEASAPPLRAACHRDATAGTCLYEVAIPWTRLTATAPAAGSTVGWTVCFGDADADPAKGFNYLAWTPGINYGKNRSDFATLVLAP